MVLAHSVSFIPFFHFFFFSFSLHSLVEDSGARYFTTVYQLHICVCVYIYYISLPDEHLSQCHDIDLTLSGMVELQHELRLKQGCLNL